MFKVRVLFVASEVAPFSKTGGLADVAGALPKALNARGVETLTVSPLWPSVPRRGLKDEGVLVQQFPFGSVTAHVRRDKNFLFIDAPGLYERKRLYGEPDDARRFAVLSTASLAAAQLIGFAPDVVHLNDWQTGLAALALSRGFSTTPLKRAKSVFTIHNLAYAGVFPKEVMYELGLPWELFTTDGIEFYDQLSFLKCGLVFADALTTVSPTYAHEIQTPEAGNGLHGLLAWRSSALHGILNGIDVSEWDPQTDKLLPAHFSPTTLAGKEACARALLEKVKLPLPKAGAKRGPIFGNVGRMVEQKGVELLIATLPGLLDRGAYAVIIGTGDERYAMALNQLAQQYPKQLHVHIGFSEELAHLIEAGSDFFLMPSRFEPCGLNQMYSLRYGTIPVVRAVGGLEDTITDLSQPEATGIKFGPFDPHALWTAIDRAFELWNAPAKLKVVQQRGMAEDNSWAHAAAQYEALYASLLPPR
jgi:starch synthase